MKDNDTFYQEFQLYFYNKFSIYFHSDKINDSISNLDKKYENAVTKILKEIEYKIQTKELESVYLPDIENQNGIIKCRKPGLAETNNYIDLLFKQYDNFITQMGVSYLFKVINEKTLLYEKEIETYYKEKNIDILLNIIAKSIPDVLGNAIIDLINPNSYYLIEVGDTITLDYYETCAKGTFKLIKKSENELKFVYNQKYILYMHFVHTDLDDTSYIAKIDLLKTH